MEQLENLARLEEAIDKLLDSQREMQQEKTRLTALLAQREQEVTNLRQQLEAVQGERSQIHQRVAGLIDSIEKWEKLSGSKGQAEEAGAKVSEGKTLF
jgi:predicted nuclease with TOPRIM domain